MESQTDPNMQPQRVRGKEEQMFHEWSHKTFSRFHIWVANSGFYPWLSGARIRRLHAKFPSLPNWAVKRIGTRGLDVPRSLEIPALPEELKTYAGVPRDREAAEAAIREEGPLPRWTSVHARGMGCLRRHQWLLDIFTIPRRNRENARVAELKKQKLGSRAIIDEAKLTRLVKEKAAEIGLSAIGITRRDPQITFAPYRDSEAIGDTVIVCVAEQAYEVTQSIPSFKAELAHYDTYMKEFPTYLAQYLKSMGYAADVYGEHGMNIAYAVEAGLGQIGLNGLLLTPFAGPRIRLHIVLTNAPLLLDKPVDYGVPAICERCQSCVRNCPAGAIRSTRDWHRGVYKAKIKTERCLPVVIQAHGCGVCMKVCPVQRYGLPAMIDEFKASGKILGVGTDELEGYVWPMDGKHYGPGEKPRAAVSPEFQNPKHYYFDPKVFDGEESTSETGGVGTVVGVKHPHDAPEAEGMPLM
jgi:epoxyqueuosine reductase